jgi:hypothetical protein
MPSRSFALLLFALSFLGGGQASAEERAAPGEDGPPKPQQPKEQPKKDPSTCVRVTTQARYIAGYDHLVHLENACEQAVRCEVSTNVNPDVQVANLAPGTKETLLTFRGSPASAFEAKVACTFVGGAK